MDPFTEELTFTLADFPNSPINIEYQACDDAGNCSVCVTTVTLIDETDPVIVCPPDVTVNTEPDACYGEVPDLMAQIADDNCAVFTITQDPIPGTLFGAQHGDVVVVSLVIEDDSNNKDTCMVNVTLNDLKNGQAGKLALSADVRVELTNGLVQAKLGGDYTFSLAADLTPAPIKGSTRLEVTRAEGALAATSRSTTAAASAAPPTSSRATSNSGSSG